jgi:PAS domain S-box-containing protein
MSKILIIDDEEMTRSTFSEILHRHHFITMEARNAGEGIAAFEKELPEAVLLDLKMPDMDGIETMKELQKIDPDIPVIIVTAHGDIQTAVEAIKEGAYDFIVKPPEYKMLVLAVNRAVDQLRLKRESMALGTQLRETEAALRELNREIHKRKRIEKALRESEMRFRLLAENSRDIIYRYRLVPERRFEYVSPAAVNIVGYTPEEHYADPDLALKIVHPDDSPKLKELFAARSFDRPLVLRWVHKEGRIVWTEERNVPVIDGAGNVVAIEGIVRDVTERKKNEEILQRYAEQLKALSYRLVEVQEEERRYVARELHDEVGQVLTGLKFSMEALVNAPDVKIKDEMGKMRELLNSLLGKVRDISLDLRPSMLDDLGLLPTMLWHFDRFTSHTNIRVAFKHNCLNGRFRPEIETTVYRVVQEALTNIARHACVSEAEVKILMESDTLLILVEDKGTGFDPETVIAFKDSVGLSGMRERLRLLGGELTIRSSPGRGTFVKAEIPMREKDRFDKE